MLAIAAMPHPQEASAAVKGRAANGLAGQQAAQKKRKRAQSEDPAGTEVLQAEAAASDADSSQHKPFDYFSCISVPASILEVQWPSYMFSPRKCSQIVQYGEEV
jgi:hypothetical protein